MSFIRPLNILTFTLCLLWLSTLSEAQSNKRYKPRKRTSKREIRKRQQEAAEKNKTTNAFNPLQTMGAAESEARDDLIWHAEAANTVYDRAGNVSITSPSRYGLNSNLELSSVLGTAYWVPNLMLKRKWLDSKWVISTRHGIYSATPGLYWAQKSGFPDIIDSTANIPIVASVKNEFLISRRFDRDLRCIQKQPYIILTLSAGIDFGVPFGESDLREMKHHFLTNRSPALTGLGSYGYAKLRGDWKAYSYLFIGTSVKAFAGNFTGRWSMEHVTDIQTFILPTLSATIGYALSYGQYNLSSNFKLLPFFDLTWYFGRKESRQKGLFKKGMF
jgi:hypothetical protein